MDSWLRISSEKAFISIQRIKSASSRLSLPKEKKPPISLCTMGAPEKPSEKLAGMTQGMP